MNESPTIVFVASDPGSANALLPVMKRMVKEPHIRLLAWPYRQAVEIWKKNGIEVEPVDETFDARRAHDLLRNNQVNLLVTGTSLNTLEVEKKFVTAARVEGIPSLSVLDFYSHYRERYSDSTGPFSCLPDRVAVMDEFSREQMISLGAPPHRVIVTGQPAFDHLAKLRLRSRAATKIAFGVAPDEKMVTFVSQPLIETYGNDPSAPQYPGYDQHVVLLHVLQTLEALAQKENRPIVLAVRIHPREDAKWFETLQSKIVRIQFLKDDDALLSIYGSDLVIGMTSTLLVESIYLGCITLSIQPETRRAENLPAITCGDMPAIYASDQITPTVSSLLYDIRRRHELQTRLLKKAPDSQATNRVIQLITEMA
jgi:hypothetical protein